MDPGYRSPLIDLFRRGDTARDMKLLAAQGAVAATAHEQVALLMLLSDDPEHLFEHLRDAASAHSDHSSRSPNDMLPLLEQLLRALHHCPEKVDQVERLIEDLARTPEGKALLPAELTAIWAPIARARSQQRAPQPPSQEHHETIP